MTSDKPILHYPVRGLCGVFGYSRQAYYKQSKREQSASIDLKLKLVKKVFNVRNKMPTAGCRFIHGEMGPGWPYGRDKTERMLLNMGFGVRYPKNLRRTTKPGSIVYPNLILGMEINDLNKVWQSDLTFFYTADGKVNYLIFIMDVYSQRIVGHGAFRSYPASVFVTVLNKAINTRKGCDLSGLIFHSDRGSQYGSKLFGNRLKHHGIIPSMGVYSWENPYAEKCNDLIKNGYLEQWNPNNMKELVVALNRAVNNHNKYQRKRTRQDMTPIDFEQYVAQCPSNKRMRITLKPKQKYVYRLVKHKTQSDINNFEDL